MIKFEDFAPKMVKSGFFGREFESLEDALAGATEWIEFNSIKVINIETVVLPQIWDKGEEGTKDPELRVNGEWTTTWHQFIRIWYKD